MKVILIDHDEALLTIFKTALEKAGFSVVTATEGQDGFEKIKSEKPNIVLLDQILPDMKGNDILKQLKETQETAHIPVAILSNFGQNELIQEAMNLGAFDYILKYQIEPNDLVNKVQGILHDQPEQKMQS